MQGENPEMLPLACVFSPLVIRVGHFHQGQAGVWREKLISRAQRTGVLMAQTVQNATIRMTHSILVKRVRNMCENGNSGDDFAVSGFGLLFLPPLLNRLTVVRRADACLRLLVGQHFLSFEDPTDQEVEHFP